MNTSNTPHAVAGNTEMRWFTHAIPIIIGSALLMTAFEVMQQLVLPAITVWQSQFISIILGMLLATCVSSIACRRYQSLYHHMLMDVDERKRDADEMRHGQEFMSTLLDSLDDGVVACDAEGKLILFNRAAREWYGTKAEGLALDEWTAVSGYTLYYPDGTTPLPTDAIPLLRAFKGETLRDIKLVVCAHDRPPRHVTASGGPIFNATGEKLGAVIATHDITAHKQADEAVRESVERYRLVVENVIESIVVVQDRVIKYGNPRAVSFSGYSLEELATRPFTALIHPDDQQMVLERYLRRVAGASGNRVYQFRIVDKAGNVKWVEIRATMVNWQGRPATLNLLNDITARVQAEQVLAHERYLMRALLDNTPDAIYFKDKLSRFIRINRAAAEWYGLNDPEQAVGKTDFDFFTPEHAQPAYDDEQDIMRTGKPIVAKEECEMRPDGVSMWVSMTKMPLRDAVGNIAGTFGVSRDITARKQIEERLLYLSIHDALTGLYNRTYFEEVLAQLSHGNPYPISVAVIDIDGMKRTNDTQGHLAGDELLRRTATVLRSVFRESDIVARIGGDEFAVLLPHTECDDALSILDKLRHKLVEHNSGFDGKPLSLSMGAATAYEYGRLAQTITNADQQMYKDKQEHRYLLAQPAHDNVN